MRKPQSKSKRLLATVLSTLLLASNCNTGFCQVASSEPAKAAETSKNNPDAVNSGLNAPTSENSKNPESDSRSASDTVWSLDSKIEKKVEQGLDQPEPKMPTGDDLLNSLKDQIPKVAVPSSQSPEATQTSTTADPGKASTPSVFMKPEPTKAGTPAPASTAKPATPVADKDKPTEVAGPGILVGRIEQISGEGDVKMPVLKAQTAVLDKRGKLLPGEVEKYSGTIAQSFPTDFRGIWGGTLQIWSYRYSPDYLTVDREEAISSAKVLKPKRSGSVNFNFHNDGRTGQVALEPATVLLTVPISDTNTFSQMTSGSSMGAFGGMFNQMMSNMEAPCIGIHFGKASASSIERGVSGNDFQQVVAKNVIRMLGPGVLEQQIVTKFTTRTPGGKTNSGFDESVMRFKKLDNNKLYVLCAAVKYGQSGKYLSKLIMYGTVDRNRRMDTNPMGQMNSMMGGMGGMNMGDMQKMMNGISGQSRGGAIQVPHGGFQNMPGMGGMGSGGAGGLNDLMKQLNQQLQNGSR